MADFDGAKVPSVTVTREIGPRFRAVIRVVGVAPQRTLSAEERLGGIESLDPPTVNSRTIQGLYDLGVRAVLTSAETSGVEITPDVLAIVSYSVAKSLQEALIALGEDA